MSLTSYRAAPPRGAGGGRRRHGAAAAGARYEGLAATYSSAPWDAVPSGLRVFTAEFGMGSGGTPLAIATRRFRYRERGSGTRDILVAAARSRRSELCGCLGGEVCRILGPRHLPGCHTRSWHLPLGAGRRGSSD